jgi:transposase InsO family protein
LFGISRQAYYQHFWTQQAASIEEELVIKEVKRLRALHPVMGTRKLQVMLEPFLLEHQIKMGRDALFELLAAYKLLVKRHKSRAVTTWSSHWMHKYPNLIRGFMPTRRNELWVSDITYWRIEKGFMYISFVTDAFTHKIIGYSISESLTAHAPVAALQMAISNRGIINGQLIHHSDRGVQYCCANYVKLLADNDIKISMTENGDPLENAIAERVNGIIKEEYLNHYNVTALDVARQQLAHAVSLYNNERPHMSCGWLTPQMVHEQQIKPQRKWKSYYNTKQPQQASPGVLKASTE